MDDLQKSELTPDEILQGLKEMQGVDEDLMIVRRNKFGGGPPPGYGAVPDELGLWTRPQFRVHPLTGRLEAVGGIFHRLWPDHVEMLLQMREDGWPHQDIVDVSHDLWERQQDEYKRNEESVGAAKDHRQANVNDDIAGALGRAGPPPPSGGAGAPPQPPPPQPDVGFDMKSLGPFRTVVKGDTTGGEMPMSPARLKVARDHTFTRKEPGVANAPFTSVDGDDAPADQPTPQKPVPVDPLTLPVNPLTRQE